jgi:hypothetical protein
LLGLPNAADTDGAAVASLMEPILARQRELSRRLADRLCPVDQRIQHFLNDYLAEIGQAPQLPRRTLVLDQPGLARGLSLPANGDIFKSPLLSSYRCATAFCTIPPVIGARRPAFSIIVEGGLPIPDDKRAVPKLAFSKLLALALNPPPESMQLPFTAGEPLPAACFRLPAFASPGGACRARFHDRKAHGNPLLRARDRWSPISISSKVIFGNAGDPTCRKTTPRSTRMAGPATPAA